MLKLAVLLAFVAVAAAADVPTFVGKFKLEADSQKSNYERIFKAVGYKPADIKKFLGLLPKLALEVKLAKHKITYIFSAGSMSASNTQDLGVRKTAKLIVGGTAQVIIFQQSNSRLAIHTTYGSKGELNTVMDCDEESCSVIHSAKGANLITKWRRVGGDDGGDGGDGGDGEE